MIQGFRVIQGFRPPRRLACAALVAAALVPAASVCAVPLTPGHRAAPPAAAAPGVVVRDDPDPDLDLDLAGSAAGAGRERPGRPAGAPANPEMLVASRPLTAVRPRTETQPPAPPRVSPSPHEVVSAFGTEPNERAADLAAHILPLGTGFALMGLGLGYLGMRLRRGL
ncbi:hypothetical protein ACFTWH_03275 [Streptomyces sp. NPDC057011]|uniref:hypothetical protein n=1 Tax=unclassified Streptomyces TaxID=2593676 RepID=UPI003642E6EB